MRAALRGCNKLAADVVTWVERSSFVDHADDLLDQMGAEFYDLLCSITGGEALTIVRTAVEMNGFMAWRALHVRFSPVTPARALAALMDVMYVPAEDDGHHVGAEGY